MKKYVILSMVTVIIVSLLFLIYSSKKGNQGNIYSPSRIISSGSLSGDLSSIQRESSFDCTTYTGSIQKNQCKTDLQLVDTALVS